MRDVNGHNVIEIDPDQRNCRTQVATIAEGATADQTLKPPRAS